MQPLTPRQRQILDFIRQHAADRGVLPSYREIGDALQIRSTNGVAEHIHTLVGRGYLQRVGRTGRGALARAIRLTDEAHVALGIGPDSTLGRAAESPPEDIVEVPVFGQVAAGGPSLAVQHHDETLRVDACMLPGGGARPFALRVRGESMINDGILPGDYLFVQKQRSVRDGEIAVVMVDGDSTVKRFYREGRRIRLQPANDTMGPIFVDASELRDVDVIGVVVGVYRRLH
jgi:repressor LexA